MLTLTNRSLTTRSITVLTLTNKSITLLTNPICAGLDYLKRLCHRDALPSLEVEVSSKCVHRLATATEISGRIRMTYISVRPPPPPPLSLPSATTETMLCDTYSIPEVYIAIVPTCLLGNCESCKDYKTERTCTNVHHATNIVKNRPIS